MAIGLMYGRDKLERPEESLPYQETMGRAGILYDRFTKEFGSIKCHDVQFKVYGKTWDFRNEEMYEELRETMMKENRCANVVRKAAEFAAEVILESE